MSDFVSQSRVLISRLSTQVSRTITRARTQVQQTNPVSARINTRADNHVTITNTTITGTAVPVVVGFEPNEEEESQHIEIIEDNSKRPVFCRFLLLQLTSVLSTVYSYF